MILSYTQDAGGARCITPILQYFASVDVATICYATAKCQTIYQQAQLDYQLVTDPSQTQPNDLLHSIDLSKLQLVILGTSTQNQLEAGLIQSCAALQIPTVSVVDEWFNFRLRFEVAGTLHLPNYILVNDSIAAQHAIEEGLPAERLHTFGHAFLAQQYHTQQASSIPADIDFLFISENHREDYGGRPGDSGPLGSFLGYTEDSVKQQLITLLSEWPTPVSTTEKRHPSSQGDASSQSIGSLQWTVAPKDANIMPLILRASTVIGMRSMALLEAATLGKPVISYQPHLIGPNQCAAVNLGMAYSADDLQALTELLAMSLAGQLAAKSSQAFDADTVANIGHFLTSVFQGAAV